MTGRRAPCVAVLALVLLVVAGGPAGAHGGPGVDTAPPAALVLATVGLAGLATLGSSQVPVDLPGGLARLAVAGSLGLGFGVVVTSGLALAVPDRSAGAVFVAFFRSDRRKSTRSGLVDPGPLVEGS